MKKIDAVEMIGRSLKIPADGLRIWDACNKKSYLLKPLELGNLRFFNHSESGEMYVLAAPFGTFICPGFLGIELLLEASGFEKVGDDMIKVPYSAYITPTCASEDFVNSKNKSFRSRALSAWEKNCEALHNSFYEI